MSTPLQSLSVGNFGALFAQWISPSTVKSLACQHRTSAAGAPPKTSTFWLLAGMVFHGLQSSGLLSTHLRQLTGRKVSDSALSERRQGLGLGFFQDLLDRVLRAIAQPTLQPKSFYKGLLLVGIDGSSWSVGNTPSIKACTRKTRSRRRAAAFFKLSMTALYELGTHNPLAARIGRKGESEMALAIPLLSLIRETWLLLADRYYGNAKFIFRLLALPLVANFLIRVRENLKSRVIKRLRDGSALVEIYDRSSKKKILLREIQARVRRRSGQWISIRLWTNLLDPMLYPAKELVALYGIRWEQEIAFKELNIHLRRSPLLLSHTLVTAAQEVACLILAQALVARVRLTAAADHTPLLQISFIHTLNALRSFWPFMQDYADLLPDQVKDQMLSRLLLLIAQQPSAPRRQRSCPRALRQPVSKWPRLLKNTKTKGAFQFKITRSKP